MRVLFVGTPKYAVPVLESVLRAGHQVVGVVTQPDKPLGRSSTLVPTPIKSLADRCRIPVLQPPSLRAPGVYQAINGMSPEVLVVAAYGKLIPLPILNCFPGKILNIHPSLLPKYRGPSPIVTAILEGETRTGVTIMALDEGMDTGPILRQKAERILDTDTTVGLTDRLFRIGSDLMLEVLHDLEMGEISAVPQDSTSATVTKMVRKADGILDFGLPAEHLYRQLRAYQPWPGVYTYWGGRVLRVLAGSPLATGSYLDQNVVGQVVALEGTGSSPMAIVTSDGLFALEWLQLEGKLPTDSSQFLRGYPQFIGSQLGL